MKGKIKQINQKIQGFSKSVKDKKKKANSYESNIQFLRYQLQQLTRLTELVEQGKLFTVENMDKLCNNYLEDIFNSYSDKVFKDDTEALYKSMFILASLKETSEESSFSNSPKQEDDKKERGVAAKKDFAQLMQLSYDNLPRWNDYRPSDQIKEQMEKKSLFPAYKMIDLSTIKAMTSDTLFFIFYYQKGAMEQYFAAKELKNRNWRYHQRYLNWFKRYDQPTVENAEFEKGKYLFFDFDKFWGNRKKSDFTIKHRSLESQI